MMAEKKIVTGTVKCLRCGSEWPQEILEGWGGPDFPETAGYGPDPVCVAIRVDPRTGAGHVCKGQLRG